MAKIVHGHNIKGKTTHFYVKWANMKTRCSNKNSTGFMYWGGKGIKVCERWNEFENFRDDMEEDYLEHRKIFGKRNTTLDRIDNSKNYSKENCRWATNTKQSENRGKMNYTKYNGKKLELNGLKMTCTQWAKYLGVKRSLLSQRFYVYKWTVEKTLTYNL